VQKSNKSIITIRKDCKFRYIHVPIHALFLPINLFSPEIGNIKTPVILSLFKSKLRLDLDPSIMTTRFGSISYSIGSTIGEVDFGLSKVKNFAKQVAKHAKRDVSFRIKNNETCKTGHFVDLTPSLDETRSNAIRKC
jgi:hypothetical protein